MKLVKSLAVATLIVGMASAQQQPNQAEWAKHVQQAQARARNRAYVDSGALDERKKAAQDRVSSFQHRGLEDAEDGDEDGNRHLQTIDGTRLPDGRFRSGTKALRENALLRRKRLYSDGMWLIGRRVYRDYPHLMAGEEEDGEDYYYEDEGMGEVYEAGDGEEAEDGAAPGQRALYSSDKFDARKDTYQARADASVNNAKNHKEKSKERAKNSGWYPNQEAEAEEEAPADAEQKKAVDNEDAEDGAAPGQRALYSSDKFDARKDTYQARADASVNNAKNHKEKSKERAKNSGWYPDQEAEAEEEAPDAEHKEAVDSEDAEDGAAPGQRALYSSDKFDARKDTYQARADASVNNAKNHKEKSKERAKNSGWYPNQEAEAEAEEEAPADAEQKKAVADEGSDLSQASEMAGFDITDPTTKMTYVGKGAAYAASGVSRAVGRGATVAEREVDFAASRAELAYKNKQDNSKGRKLRGGRA